MFKSALKLGRNVSMACRGPPNTLIVVLGATGTGKSQLAVEIALKHNGEIINGDAMQMYEGLPIITNKIMAKEQQGIPHHLLGVVGLEEETWTVGVFKKKAQSIIEEIRSRGKLPILVGGTHYYTQSLLFREQLVTQPSGGEDLETEHVPREELIMQHPILDASTEEILEQLKQVDPIMAARWHPNDRRKILRSLEIYLTTGRKASDVYQEQREKKLAAQQAEEDQGEEITSQLKSTLLFWVHANPDVLKPRLDARVDKMVATGLVEEVKTLEEFSREQETRGQLIDKSRGIWVSIGNKEFEPYLQALKNETTSEELKTSLRNEAIERTKIATRQYARSQVRWIRTKLMAAMIGEAELHRLYVLDGSDIDRWKTSVSAPTLDITLRRSSCVQNNKVMIMGKGQIYGSEKSANFVM